MARNKRAPVRLLLQREDGNSHVTTIPPKVLGRLRELNSVMQQAQARFGQVRDDTAAKEQAFAQAMRIYAEMAGLDPERDFQYNLDEGWIAPPKETAGA